jgi:hypothetical protein
MRRGRRVGRTRASGARRTRGAALLALYSGAIGVNLARGRRRDRLRLLRPAQRQPLSLALLLRNAGLIALALVCALPVARASCRSTRSRSRRCSRSARSSRAVNGLIANAPRLRALREA